MTTALRRLGPALTVPLVLIATGLAVAGLARAVDGAVLDDAALAAVQDLPGALLAISAFGLAFVARALGWARLHPDLSVGQALSAIHLALGGNHVLPLRLGEPLRAVSVVRRAGIDPGDGLLSTVVMRSADILTLGGLGAAALAAVLARGSGLTAEAPPMIGAAAALILIAVVGSVAWWLLRRRAAEGRRVATPDATALLLTGVAWLLEAVLIIVVASWFGIEVGMPEALVVLAAAITAQLVAITPGGIGTYEAAAAAGFVLLGVDPGTGLAAALGIHALKTVYSLVAGAIALILPAPAMWGRLRLPAVPKSATGPAGPTGTSGPIVLFLPAHDEGPRVGQVITRAPQQIAGHPVEVLVIDDGSTDDTAAQARSAGAMVIGHPTNLGLGAAVRTGLHAATARGASAVAFCDADGEYDPAELAALVTPVLDGSADYVIGSRFAGQIDHMRPHRRFGNQVLTRWVRWTVRQPVTDGQSGYRAFSAAAAAAARIPHDYNYAQVLTIDLLQQGFRYHEVPITYAFRTSGRSFIRLGRYLRRVVPTVWQQLNPRPATR